MTNNNYLKIASNLAAPPLPTRPGGQANNLGREKSFDNISFEAFRALPQQSLDSEEWYWGKISRDEAGELLKCKRDGSFLVRDSATVEGEYTLTVRKSNINRLLKITSHKGLFGVCHPYRFSSVVDLIEYYLKHSLAEFSGKLDIHLKYPISKTTDDVNKDVILDRLKEISTQIIKLNEYFTEIELDYEKSKATLEELSVICRAQEVLEQFLHDHLTSMNTILKSGMMVEELRESKIQFQRQYNEEKNLVTVLNDNLEKETLNQAELQKKVNLLRTNLNTLMQQKDKYERWLYDNGVKSEEIEAKLQESLLDEDIYGSGMTSFKLLHKNSRLDQELGMLPLPPPETIPLPDAMAIMTDVCNLSLMENNQDELDTKPLPPPPLDRRNDYFDVELPSETTSSPIPAPRPTKLTSQTTKFGQDSWMAKNLNRFETENIFKQKGQQEGSFIVRPTTKVEDPTHRYTLEVKSSEKICRLKIFFEKGLYHFSKGSQFQSVEDLIDYYSKNCLSEIISSLTVTLSNPLLK